MSYRPKTIRRAPGQVRKYMRSYNELAKGLRQLRKLIDAEVKLSLTRKKSVRDVKEKAEEAEELFGGVE